MLFYGIIRSMTHSNITSTWPLVWIWRNFNFRPFMFARI